jgi:5-dehydro-4-deoxyglucarate dehydratase
MSRPIPLPQGTIGFPVTPWTNDLSLDDRALEVHATRMLDSGLEALSFCGSNGELHSLTWSDYQEICAVAGAITAGRAYLIFGVGQSWSAARAQAAAARIAGAQAVLCIAPYMADANEPGLAAYYRDVADAAEIDLILYQTKWSGLLPLTLLERLEDVENIRMIKDENGNLTHYLNVRRHFGDRFHWINGMAEPFVPSYWKLGVETFTSGLACFMPQVTLRIRELAREDDFAGVNRILDDLVIPMYELRNRRPGYKVSMIKTAMSLSGMNAGSVRPPLIPMDPADKEDLRVLMARHGLLAK